MSLKDEIKNRIPKQRLVELTNADNPDATEINEDILDKAIIDTQNEFSINTGEIFSEDNNQHISIGILGVLVQLHKYCQILSDNTQKLYDNWISMLYKYRITFGANKRIIPTTTSLLEPTTELEGGRAVAPDFDKRVFDEIVPKKPASARDDKSQSDVNL